MLLVLFISLQPTFNFLTPLPRNSSTLKKDFFECLKIKQYTLHTCVETIKIIKKNYLGLTSGSGT